MVQYQADLPSPPAPFIPDGKPIARGPRPVFPMNLIDKSEHTEMDRHPQEVMEKLLIWSRRPFTAPILEKLSDTRDYYKNEGSAPRQPQAQYVHSQAYYNRFRNQEDLHGNGPVNGEAPSVSPAALWP